MSAVTFQSIRFGTLEVPVEDVIEFPLGLIGLGGRHYALIDRNPGTGFLWLHSTEDEALGLPVVNPNLFFPEFTLHLSAEDRQRIGLEDSGLEDSSVGGAAGIGLEGDSAPALYVTVRATPDPFDITANLRAPLVVHEGRGYQVINASMEAPLQAPLFVRAQQPVAEPSQSADAA
jgi:flagellar assembly factor FliW